MPIEEIEIDKEKFFEFLEANAEREFDMQSTCGCAMGSYFAEGLGLRCHWSIGYDSYEAWEDGDVDHYPSVNLPDWFKGVAERLLDDRDITDISGGELLDYLKARS